MEKITFFLILYYQMLCYRFDNDDSGGPGDGDVAFLKILKLFCVCVQRKIHIFFLNK